MCDESQRRIAFDTDTCASTAVHAHAKQELSENFNASNLELQQARGKLVPSFPCETVVQPQDVAVHYSSEAITPDPNSVPRWGQRLARDISTTVHQRDSRLECGDGDTHICEHPLEHWPGAAPWD